MQTAILRMHAWRARRRNNRLENCCLFVVRFIMEEGGKREERGSYRSSKKELGIELRATGIGGGISSLRTTISLTYLFYLRSIHGMS